MTKKKKTGAEENEFKRKKRTIPTKMFALEQNALR